MGPATRRLDARFQELSHSEEEKGVRRIVSHRFSQLGRSGSFGYWSARIIFRISFTSACTEMPLVPRTQAGERMVSLTRPITRPWWLRSRLSLQLHAVAMMAGLAASGSPHPPPVRGR